jgi:hypothetical protein
MQELHDVSDEDPEQEEARSVQLEKELLALNNRLALHEYGKQATLAGVHIHDLVG